MGWATNNIIIDTKAPNGTLRNWFFDPTPFENNEFAPMGQTFVRDVFDQADIDTAFADNPQDALEVGYNGFALWDAHRRL